MAGGGSLGAPEHVKRGKPSKRKKKKRLSFHLDMTPLVDITMLLLTFFMFTTSMLKPQTMEMSVPPDDKQNIQQSATNMFTILVRDDNQVFYYKGMLNAENVKPIEIKDIRDMAAKENLVPEVLNKLITALRVAPNAKWDVVVSILDQLNVAETIITEKLPPGEVRKRKFSMTPLMPDELEIIKGK